MACAPAHGWLVWAVDRAPTPPANARNFVKGSSVFLVGQRWQKWAEGTAEARPRLSNSRARNRLVSLTTEMKSAHLLLGVGFVCLQKALGLGDKKGNPFIISAATRLRKVANSYCMINNIENVPGGTMISVI